MVESVSAPGSGGIGWANPATGNSDLSVISFIVRQMIARLDTMKLVQVTAVHGGGVAAAGTVDVHPLVTMIDQDRNSTPHGVVYGIPWTRVQGGRNAVICDPQVDDIGYVVASDRDISTLKSALKESTPGSFRRYSIADGVYAGACLNSAVPNQYIYFAADGVEIVSNQKITFTVGSTSIVLDGTNIHLNGPMIMNGVASGPGSIVDFGASTVKTTGDVTAGTISLKTHRTSGITVGSGTSSTPVP